MTSIPVVNTTGSDYWAAYVGGAKDKINGPKDKPEPMSLPINDLSYDDDVWLDR